MQMQIAQERAKQLRRIHAIIKSLAGAAEVSCPCVTHMIALTAGWLCRLERCDQGSVLPLNWQHEICGQQGLRQAGLDGAQVVALSQYHLQLCTAFERMANIKEFRCSAFQSPLLAHACSTCTVALPTRVCRSPHEVCG